jgi:hypothetical protein
MESKAQPEAAAPAKPKRWWLQYSTRALLALLTLSCLTIGIISRRAERQRQAVAAIEELGGQVFYDSDALLRTPKWWLPRDYVDKVVRVEIVGAKCTDDSLAHVSDLADLRELSLHCPRVADEGIQHLAGMRWLETLSLSGTSLTDAGLVHLRNLKALLRLELDNTRITDKGMRELKNRQLVYLSLRDTKVTDLGLAELRMESALQELRLDGTQVTDSGLLHLKSATWLEAISCDATQVTDDGFAALRKAIPHCERQSREWRFGFRTSTLD